MHLSFFNKKYAVRRFCKLSFLLHYDVNRFFLFFQYPSWLRISILDMSNLIFPSLELEVKKKCLFRQAYISIFLFIKISPRYCKNLIFYTFSHFKCQLKIFSYIKFYIHLIKN